MKGSMLGTRRGRMAGSWAAACLVTATVVTVVPASPAAAAPGDITTIAGTGDPDGALGNGGPATAASLRGPWGLERVGRRLYVSEEGRHLVRRIVNGSITSFAGAGTPPLGDGLKAREATFNGPQGLTFDSAGNLFIADSFNDRVRRVDAVTKIVTTVAERASPASAATAAPPPRPNWTTPSGWPSTPSETCSSATPATTGSGVSTPSPGSSPQSPATVPPPRRATAAPPLPQG